MMKSVKKTFTESTPFVSTHARSYACVRTSARAFKLFLSLFLFLIILSVSDPTASAVTCVCVCVCAYLPLPLERSADHLLSLKARVNLLERASPLYVTPSPSKEARGFPLLTGAVYSPQSVA